MVPVSGLVVTKLDGTARGGVVVALARQFGLPVRALGVGEGVDDLRPFEAKRLRRRPAGPRDGVGLTRLRRAGARAGDACARWRSTMLGALSLNRPRIQDHDPQCARDPARRDRAGRRDRFSDLRLPQQPGRRYRRLRAGRQVRSGRRPGARRRRPDQRHQGRHGDRRRSSIPRPSAPRCASPCTTASSCRPTARRRWSATVCSAASICRWCRAATSRCCKAGDEVTLTQSSINLEDLIGHLIFCQGSSGQGAVPEPGRRGRGRPGSRRPEPGRRGRGRAGRRRSGRRRQVPATRAREPVTVG